MLFVFFPAYTEFSAKTDFLHLLLKLRLPACVSHKLVSYFEKDMFDFLADPKMLYRFTYWNANGLGRQ